MFQTQLVHKVVHEQKKERAMAIVNTADVVDCYCKTLDEVRQS